MITKSWKLTFYISELQRSTQLDKTYSFLKLVLDVLYYILNFLHFSKRIGNISPNNHLEHKKFERKQLKFLLRKPLAATTTHCKPARKS